MGKIRLGLFLGFWICLGFATQAQNRYAVHYKFKPQENFSLENGNAFLTAKSLERRDRQQIALDSMDLPVSTKYIESLAPHVVEFLYQSHWLNASVVVATVEEVEVIRGFDFVEKVVFAAPNFNPSSKMEFKMTDKAGMNFNLRKKGNSTHDTPIFDFQNRLLGIQEMHESGFKGKGVTVAVFDAGFPGVDLIPVFAHLHDYNQIVGTRDFVHVWNDNVYTKNQHGTNVLSLMAANDEETLLSGAPDANYILCITEEVPTEYRIEEYNWVKAAEYADSLGVDIINSSLGYFDFDDKSMDYTVEDLNGETAIISQGASIAGDKGILVVTSAGNYGSRGERSITAPADAKGILSVGSVNSSLERSNFSSQGPTADGRIKPEVTTFGEQVWLMRFNGILGRANGTSFSAPQIAAMAAGLWEAKPEWTKDELIKYLQASATNADDPDNLIGFGIPNFQKAYLGEILNVTETELAQAWKIYPNPVMGSNLFIQFGNYEQGEFTLIDTKGRTVQKTNVSRSSNKEPFEILLVEIPQGLYVIEMQSGNQVKRTKILKK